MWIQGIGDCDNDGLYEIMGGDPDSNFLYLMEQADSFSYPNSITWHSDTIFETFRDVMITDEIEYSGQDCIAGVGAPENSTTSRARGFYYYECTGDNEFQLKSFFVNQGITGDVDIGDFNNNGLVEFITFFGDDILVFEATDINSDSFTIENG